MHGTRHTDPCTLEQPATCSPPCCRQCLLSGRCQKGQQRSRRGRGFPLPPAASAVPRVRIAGRLVRPAAPPHPGCAVTLRRATSSFF